MSSSEAATAAPSSEIETFNRRKIAIIPFLFSIINLILIWPTRPLYRYNENFSYGLFFTCFSVLTLIHLFYTAVLLLAPRFLYRGEVWIKTIPWIISSASLFAIYFFMEPSSLFKYFYCFFGFLLQLFQYIICILQEESKFSFIFKPFERRMIPNLLAKIDLSDPNARLDTIYGPAITIPSTIPGQRPAVIRYGSQAIKIQPQLPIQQQHQSLAYFKPSTPASVSVTEEFPPAYSPPVYEATINSEKSLFNDDKSQYDMKK